MRKTQKLRYQNNSLPIGKTGNSIYPINLLTSGGKCKIRTIKINNRKSLLSNKLHSPQVVKIKFKFPTS